MGPIHVGIDLGGTNIQGAAARGQTILSRRKIPTRVKLGPTTVLADLAALARDLAADQGLAALGIGIPGLLDLERGVCLAADNLGWRDVPVAAVLTEQLQAPVFIENDARVAALGELATGKAKGRSNFIYITVGTGIGAGIFVEGRMLRGARWAAGEVGHMQMDPTGAVCACGGRGCLEALAAAPAIQRKGRAVAAANPASLLNSLPEGEIDAAVVFKFAADGDRWAQQIVDETMGWLGIAVANLVNIFNPELVVIGGGVSLAGEQLLAPVQAQIARHCMRVQKETVSLVTSGLDDSAGVAGALELVRQSLDRGGL